MERAQREWENNGVVGEIVEREREKSSGVLYGKKGEGGDNATLES